MSAPAPTAGQAANASPAATLQNGDGFEQFVAQARLAQAKQEGNERLAQNAAQTTAAFRANSQLRKDEWKTLDENLLEVAQRNLTIVDDLRSAGLTVSEDLATLIREWESTGEFDDADIDMGAETGSSEDTTTFSLNGVPLPIVHKSFSIKRRKLLASRRRGQSLDTSNQSKAARKVFEGLENMVFNGWNGQVEGYDVPGLKNQADVNNVTGSDWTSASANTIREDFYATVEALEDANYGPEGAPYWGYVARPQYQELRATDTGTDEERSVLARIREEITEVERIRRADFLDDGEAVFFKPVEDVVQLAVASDFQNVEWDSADGFTRHMKVMASMTPIVKSDENGQSGVAHLTGI